MNNSKAPNENDTIDIEDYAKAGKPVPKGKRYRFKVGKDKFETDKEKLKGREILTIAGKTPPENWLLSQKKGKAVVQIELDQEVDLTEPGVERFMVMPKDQTEGESVATFRRQFSLPADDVEGLDELGLPWETVLEGGAMWLLVHEHPLPAGYTIPLATVAIRISQNYPIEQLDMVYFFPAIVRADGVAIGATESYQAIAGQNFQRWSRHYTAANPWVPGEFSVLTHLALIRHWLEREFKKAA
jgi:hypothetical protein